MTNGRTSRVARLHEQMTARASKHEETVAELRAKVRDADNEVYRLREELSGVRDRLERLERAQEPKGYRGRTRA